MSAPTPLMRQYLSFKADYPDKLLLFRMGDFYELFFADAERISTLLGLTLTRRGGGGGATPVPMAGIPYHALEQYLAKLLKLGESAVICDQIGEPDGKTLMQRRITRIVTPGTITEPGLLPDNEGRLLAALAPGSGDAMGYAWLDVAQGKFRAGDSTAAEIPDVLARLRPAELLIPENFTFSPPPPPCVTQSLPPWRFDPAESARALQKRFAVSSLTAFGLTDRPAATAAAAALLRYAEDAHKQPLQHIDGLGVENNDAFIGMTAATRAGLELTRTLSGKESPTLLSFMDACQTRMGARHLSDLLHNPPRDRTAVRAAHGAIAALLAGDGAAALAAALGEARDLPRIAARIATRSAQPRELTAARQTYAALPAIAAALAAPDDPHLTRLAAVCRPDGMVLDLLQQALAQDPPSVLRDGNVIAAGYSAELDHLRELQNGAKSNLEDITTRERQATGIATLRVHYNKVHGFYLEIPKSQAGAAPAAWQRRQTLKNAERYITPELKRLEEQSLSAETRANALERRLYDSILDALQPRVSEMQDIAAALMRADVLAAFTDRAAAGGWTRPEFSDKNEIRIRAGRHPVVQSQVAHFVANDLHLHPHQRVALVTGPNMGGKSTYLRQTAVIAILAHCGAYVPAEQAVIGDIDKIFTRIGASDDLAGGRSTFMVEMTETAEILHNAGERSLVLLDEIGRGTATYDGLALAWAITESLLQKNRAMALFATHYFELTALAADHPSATNCHVAAREHQDTIVFMHEVHPGAASRSYGIQVAKLAGVPPTVIARAGALLDEFEKAAPTAPATPSLFPPPSSAAAPPPEDPVRRRLSELAPDALTPKAALDALYELHQLAAAHPPDTA